MARKTKKSGIDKGKPEEKDLQGVDGQKEHIVKQAVEFERLRLKEVLEILPAYVVLLTPDYHVPFANRFFRERFGDSKGRRCFEYLFNRSEPCEICETFKVLKTNAPHRWEWTGPDKRIYDIYDFPFADADGSRLILETGIDVTERKQAEAALQELNKTLEQRVAERTAQLSESEAKCRIVADNTYDFEFWLDPDGKFLYCSPSCERVTGYEAYKFLQDPDIKFKIIHSDDRKVFQEHVRNEVKQRKHGELEFRIIRKDGATRWVHHVCQPIFDSAGVFKGTRGSNRDITTRKRAEVAMRESEERLKHAQEIAHLGSWELDLVSNKLVWSDEVYRIFGLEPQQFGATYEAFLSAVHPDDRAAVDAAYSSSVHESRDSYEIEHRVVRPDGEIRSVREKCFNVRDESGKIIKSIGMVHDITVQKQQEEQRMAKVQMEAALKELQEFLRLFETVEVALVLIEHDGTVKYANNRAKAMLQVQPKDNITDYFDNDIISPRSFSNEIYFSKAVRRSFIVSRQDYKDMYLLVVDSMQEEIVKGKKILSATAPYTFDDIVGLDGVKGKAHDLAVQNVNILLLGESGTGKELFASAIHNASPRAGNRFVVVHCGAIPDTLFESELFGHEKGAFTDARSARTGKIEYADGGTVFFDELGDLPLSVQSKLLRVIEDKHVVPVGSNEPKTVDVRFIFATNRNLEEMVKKREFREDLYYRINSLIIKIPPLRERKKELEGLIKHLVAKMQVTYNRYISDISDDTNNKLVAYDFPGNVRELEGIIRNAFLSSKGDKIEISDLKLEKLDRELISLKVKKYRALLIYEHFLLNNKNYSHTAKDLKMSSRQVYRYVKLAEESGPG